MHLIVSVKIWNFKNSRYASFSVMDAEGISRRFTPHRGFRPSDVAYTPVTPDMWETPVSHPLPVLILQLMFLGKC